MRSTPRWSTSATAGPKKSGARRQDRAGAWAGVAGRAWAAQQAGTLGQIFVLMDHLHNMIVTTIWGTPSPETAWRIPTTPCLSILGADGERLRAQLARGRYACG